jgi:16S rRNA (cytosine1402-N4)-methyltransferase
MGHNHTIDEFFNESYIHKPVLWREIVDIIDCSLKKGSGHLVDCTLGEGGHSEIFLKLYPEMKITAFERDSEILARAKERLSAFGSRIAYINSNFSGIADLLPPDNPPDYILYDFGISSYHFDKSGRGFTFASDEPLDMSLGCTELNASDVINKYPEKELARIFREYGEENWAAWIAKIIVERRAAKPVETSAELASIVLAAIPKKFHVKNIHPATRVFQAVRIEVNRELQSIEAGLKGGFQMLAEGGVMMAISFHSLEDRIAKIFFRRMKDGCLCGAEPDKCNCMNRSFAELLTKKPVTADEDELRWNNRSRSAKLRAARKIRSF